MPPPSLLLYTDIDPSASLQFMQRSAASSTSSRTDTLAVREALVQESAKRDAALQARERNGPTASVDAETRWELSYVKKIDGARRAAVVDWSYGEVVGDGDAAASESASESGSESESESEPKQRGVKSGRMVFGKFRSKVEVGFAFFFFTTLVWLNTANVFAARQDGGGQGRRLRLGYCGRTQDQECLPPRTHVHLEFRRPRGGDGVSWVPEEGPQPGKVPSGEMLRV